MPSLHDIFEADVATCKYVPRGARVEWGECLAQALAAVVHENSEVAWVQLFLLPQAVLCTAPPMYARGLCAIFL